ncbi:MAG: hypothetical protein ABFD15_05705 [Methanofastidiosum sp.]
MFYTLTDDQCTNIFFDNVLKDEYIIILAIKMAIKGMSIDVIADVLEV